MKRTASLLIRKCYNFCSFSVHRINWILHKRLSVKIYCKFCTSIPTVIYTKAQVNISWSRNSNMSLSTFVKLFGYVFINILKYLEANVRKNVQITLETRHFRSSEFIVLFMVGLQAILTMSLRLRLKQLGNFWKCIFFILFPITVIFLYETGAI